MIAGNTIHWWSIAAGVGLFLFGLRLVEQALAVLAGRRFKQFIRRNTSVPLKSIWTGTIATAILQSSSIVGLTVLAFVGAGLVTMRNAIGVILGSNLGTTFTGWLVVIFGFKLPLDNAALPLVAVGTITLVTLKGMERASSVGRVAAGAGFVLLGLSFMKSGVAEFSAAIDLGTYSGLPLIAWLGIGAGLTAVIQSSSAMMMIALSALFGGLLTLEQAAAVAIGADLGTTVTVLIGAWRGTPSKKRVALAHLLFNLATDAIAFILLKPLLHLLTQTMGLQDPLFILVAFHSCFNAMGILLFYPFLGQFSRFLERRFTAEEDDSSTRFISRVGSEVPDVALQALARETGFLIGEASLLNRKALRLNIPTHQAFKESFVLKHDYDKGYDFIKRIEGELLEFSHRLEEEKLDKALAERLHHLMSAARNAVHACKSTKDVRHDLEVFQRSVSDYLAGFQSRLKGDFVRFYEHFDRAMGLDQPETVVETLLDLMKENNDLHDKLHTTIKQEAMRHDLTETEISTLLNVNRELYNSNREIVLAVKDWKLSPRLAEEFMSFPGVG